MGLPGRASRRAMGRKSLGEGWPTPAERGRVASTWTGPSKAGLVMERANVPLPGWAGLRALSGVVVCVASRVKAGRLATKSGWAGASRRMFCWPVLRRTALSA